MNGTAPTDHPLNVLWLTSDQHSSHALGCYGNQVVQTPNLDRLAAEGVCFDQHFCSYPVCVPARFTMMTGLYPHHHGAVSNNTPLPLRTRTVAHHFGQAGYVSHMDACAGRILDALARLGLAENTLVVYTTDHGEMLGEHGLRGKFCFFDGSARLPLIARLPGHIPAGHRSTALVDQSDFVPTF